ncbi:hypothetical protein AQI95_11890 [Streptomyces yokosukanensis]|uniref:Uncharacterized protein n=1 Tax=Streptomyces yokosukanensis TaxID=67386 RepID=A0A117Q3R7_9ACTN|nr:hypothetical protein AQI95_11890 [Streptomyces yokosukanensis]
MPGGAEDPAVVRRQGPGKRCQAAELLAELDEDGFESEDDFESDEEEPVDDVLEDFDAGLLLDVEPRESLR